ncbi:AAA family ATPase [Hyphomicrobium sp. 1Nfss2.1]|uniref:AAA family ATPase n=1 Tax=Hyphomicrobium sp. 1Nfss2.1 TaxID=3413936 RepID=UPI003C7AD793
MCAASDVVTAATVVDHIEPHHGDQVLFWDETNWQSLCVTHHNATKQRMEKRGYAHGSDASGRPVDPTHPWRKPKLSAQAEQRRLPRHLKPSRIPCTIVCGPPGAGKSTYVRQHATDRDVVICLDTILAELSGRPEHHANGGEWIEPALYERNARLDALASDHTHERAWFVICADDPAERAHWSRMLGAEVVVIATPLAECIRRIEADPSRRGNTRRMIEAARQWWQLNQEAA